MTTRIDTRAELPGAVPPRASRVHDLVARTSVHVVGAVVVMGGWAAIANRAHGARAVLSAALVQAAASATVTYTLKTSLQAMARRLRGALAFVGPPTATCVVVLILLVAVHRLAGTRELWRTIALPYAASSAYAWVYTILVHRSEAKARAAG